MVKATKLPNLNHPIVKTSALSLQEKAKAITDEKAFYAVVLELFKRTDVSNKELLKLKKPTTPLVYIGDCYKELAAAAQAFVLTKTDTSYTFKPSVVQMAVFYQGMVSYVAMNGAPFLKIEKDDLVFQMFIS